MARVRKQFWVSFAEWRKDAMSPAAAVKFPRHHRKRRFHVHPRALSWGLFDRESMVEPAVPNQPKPLGESELPNPAKEGMLICIKILYLLGILLLLSSLVKSKAADLENWINWVLRFRAF
jgi:hypothetical protein